MPSLNFYRPDALPDAQPEHVSGVGAAEFPLVAQTYFCDSCFPLRDLPLQLIFSHPLTTPLPLTRFLARSAPVRSNV